MNKNKTNHSSLSLLPVGEGLGVRLFTFCLCFLFFSCSQEESVRESEGTVVGFTLPDMGSEVTSGSATRAALAAGATVRVVVYKTGSQSNANYVTTKTYTMQADGNLKADDTDIRLIEDTYDFYTVTPALEVDVTGSSPTVKVPQQVDFATSLTTGQKITKWDNSAENVNTPRKIALNELTRQCAKLSFGVEVASDVDISVMNPRVIEVVLTDMPEGPFPATGTGALTPGSGSNTLSITSSLLAADTQDPRKGMSSITLLPKTSGAFNLSMKVQFNGVTSISTAFPAQPVPAISFEAGYEYTFTIRLTKNNLGDPATGLWLTISKWLSKEPVYSLGGVPTGPINTLLIGEWTNFSWESGLGTID